MNALSIKESLSEDTPRYGVRQELRTTILVGVGSTDTYIPALELIARLKLANPEITLLHAVDTSCPIANADARTEMEYAKVVENLGIRVLDLAKKQARVKHLTVKTEMVFGRAADSMISKADKDRSEIIALCAVKHGAWSNAYTGSATCALALNASQSLLIGKASLSHNNPLRAILAIDHSTKSGALLQNFFNLRPQGISEVLVVSAYEIDDETAKAAQEKLPMLGGDIDRLLQENFASKNMKLVEALREVGYKAEHKVVCGRPTDVLPQAMKEFQGDLMIIGATGDGGPTGSNIGSVALHQIISEPYSVLMLRSSDRH